uniref:Dickkopf like acrosomal protein 1 n=1 Tax=Crocodylus porosus TaxID=8502 RepID=A0A7M4FFF7_CROPO
MQGCAAGSAVPAAPSRAGPGLHPPGGRVAGTLSASLCRSARSRPRLAAEMAVRGLPGALLLLLLLLAWEGAGAPAPALLPPAALHRFLGDLSSMMQRSRVRPGRGGGCGFETPVDFSKLPPNYHDEEKEERRVGNATVYSHREINKVTDNRTGETVFSEKTVTSIEQGDQGLQTKHSEERTGKEADVQPAAARHLPLIVRPRLTFLIIRLPHKVRLTKKAIKKSGNSALSNRRHRLLAIRDGLKEAPHPEKKGPSSHGTGGGWLRKTGQGPFPSRGY